MTEETTPTETGGEEKEFAHLNNQGRSTAIEEIAAKAIAEVAVDMADIDEEAGEVIARKPTAEAKAPAEVAEGDEPEDAEPEDKPEPKRRTIVVDGQSIEVTEEQVIAAGTRTLQKESAADRRLAEASQIKQQAQELFAQARRASSDPAQNLEPSQDAPSLHQATTGIDPAALDTYLYQRDYRLAAKALEKDFADIVFDDELALLVAKREQKRVLEAQAIGEPLGNPIDALREHCIAVRARLGKPAETKSAVVSEDKAERKRNITAIGGANAKAATSQEPKPLTTAEVIEQIRQQRTVGRPLVKH